MKRFSFLVLLSVLFVSNYALAQIPSCPCDTHELPNGTTGNEIIELLCPGGELSEGVTFDLFSNIVRISSEDGGGYSVQNIPEIDSIACGIAFMGQNEGVKITAQEAEVCRTGLIQRCNLKIINPIPTLSEWGVIAMAGLMGIVGFIVMRRKKVAA